MTLEQFKGLFADLARPFTFYSLATASCAAILKLAWGLGGAIAAGTADGYQASALVGVILAGASAIYIGKSFENKWTANASADVEKVRASQGSPPPAEALKPAPPPTDAEPDEDLTMYAGPRG